VLTPWILVGSERIEDLGRNKNSHGDGTAKAVADEMDMNTNSEALGI
jgi:hypothetical protein